jgi:heat-inducible transcriptional repressor
METLTARQADILRTIVETYADVSSPVGSVALSKIFNLSPATVRSEMAELERLGFISQPHTSAGRIPTDKGYRLYVNGITDSESSACKTFELDIKPSRVIRAIGASSDSAGQPDRAIKNAVDNLVSLTHNLGLATIGDQLYLSGLANLFSQPEFFAADSIKEVASLLDNLEPWLREAAPNQPISVYIGAENPIGGASGCSLIISKFSSPFSENSYIGVLGSTRQNYSQVINLVQNTGLMLQNLFR